MPPILLNINWPTTLTHNQYQPALYKRMATSPTAKV